MKANIILESFVREVMPQKSPKEHVFCFLDYPFLAVTLVSTKNGLLSLFDRHLKRFYASQPLVREKVVFKLGIPLLLFIPSFKKGL
jgi:hypothetical protein